jgi:hypothetical protein
MSARLLATSAMISGRASPGCRKQQQQQQRWRWQQQQVKLGVANAAKAGHLCNELKESKPRLQETAAAAAYRSSSSCRHGSVMQQQQKQLRRLEQLKMIQTDST